MTSEKHILIVEDSESVARLLRAVLSEKGFRVSWVADGKDGLEAILCARPDLVILDLNLPGMSGEEVCRRIKDSYDLELRAIPILVLTARSSPTDRVVVKTYGADDYMTKPFQVDRVLKTVDQLLAQSV